MTRFLIIFLIVLLGMPLQSAHILFNLEDFVTNPLSIKQVKLTPTDQPSAVGTFIVTKDTRTQQTGTNGSTTFSNVVAGEYRVDVVGPTLTTTFTILVTNTSATINANLIMSSGTNISPSSVAYSMTSADGRFLRNIIYTNGTAASTQAFLNFVYGTNMAIRTTNNSTTGQTDVYLSSSASGGGGGLVGVQGNTNANQWFEIGSAGLVPNITTNGVGANATNTINLPTADNTHSGILSSNDWQTFIGKQASNVVLATLINTPSITNVPSGRIVWVDQVNGNDSTGRRGAVMFPFLTLTAAKNAATAGDTVWTLPGDYLGTNLLKNGVNYNFSAGAVVTNLGSLGNTFTASTFHDYAGATTNIISGDGDFHVLYETNVTTVLDGGVVSLSNANSQVWFTGNRLKVREFGTSEPLHAFRIINCRSFIASVREIEDPDVFRDSFNADEEPIASGAGGIYWENGECHITCDRINVESGYGIWASGTTNDFYYRGQLIKTVTGPAFYTSSSSEENRVWLDVLEIDSGGAAVSTVAGLSRIYINAQKIKGTAPAIASQGQSLWVTAQKLTTTSSSASGSFLNLQGGRNFFKIIDYEMTDRAAIANAVAVSISGGTNLLDGGTFRGITNAIGLKYSGSAITRLKDVTLQTFNTSATGDTNEPVLVMTNGLTLQNVSLIAPNANVSSIKATNSANTIAIDGALQTTTAAGSSVVFSKGLHLVNTNLYVFGSQTVNGSVTNKASVAFEHGATGSTLITSSMDADGSIFKIFDSDADAANNTVLVQLDHNDSADANVIYFLGRADASGAPVEDYKLSQTAMTIGASIAATFAGSLGVPNGAGPTTDAFGEIAGDNNAWASGRGALQIYDGTANTYAVATLASDTPGNGQVPKWNTGGTITWEDDSTGGGGSGIPVVAGSGTNTTIVSNLTVQAMGNVPTDGTATPLLLVYSHTNHNNKIHTPWGLSVVQFANSAGGASNTFWALGDNPYRHSSTDASVNLIWENRYNTGTSTQKEFYVRLDRAGSSSDVRPLMIEWTTNGSLIKTLLAGPVRIANTDHSTNWLSFEQNFQHSMIASLFNFEGADGGVGEMRFKKRSAIVWYNASDTQIAAAQVNTVNSFVINNIGAGNTNLHLQFPQVQIGTTTNVIVRTNHVDIPRGRLTIGPSSASITNFLVATANLDFPDTAAQTHSDLAITVTGTTTNDFPTVAWPPQVQMDGASYSCFPSNDTVWVRFLNASSSSKNPAAGTYRALVTKVQ